MQRAQGPPGLRDACIVGPTFQRPLFVRLLGQNLAADRLRESLERIGLGRLEAPPARVARPADRKKRGLAPTVRFDSGGCEAATLVEVVAENRPGLLCSLASVFSSAACNIDVVLVDTKGNRALDVFYVARDGKKLTPELESALRDRLLAAC